MKKFILILLVSGLVVFETKAIPPGLWFSQIFGYTCTYSVVSSIDISEWPPNGPEGLCYKNFRETCTSWLWGTKTQDFPDWGSCEGNPPAQILNPPPPSNFYEFVAEWWTVQQANNVPGIDPDWLDPEALENEATLKAAAVYRLILAGYDADISWIDESEACNFNDGPTLTVVIPIIEPVVVDDCN